MRRPRPTYRLALAALALPLTAQTAQARTVAVVSDGRAPEAAALELELSRQADTVLVLEPSQQDALRLMGRTDASGLDEAATLRLGRLSGAETVVVLGSSGRSCATATARCTSFDGTMAAARAAVSVSAPTLPAAPTDAVLRDYAECRGAVLRELDAVAIQGTRTASGQVPAACERVGNVANFVPGKAALATARTLAGGSWEALPRLGREVPDDALVGPVLAWAVLSDESLSSGARAALLVDALAVAPRSVELARVVGEFHYRMDDLDMAQVELSRAAALAPRAPALLSRQSYVLHAKGRHAESCTLAERAARLGDNVPHYQLEYGSRLIDLGRFAEAVAVLTPLHQADAGWGRAALRLGYAQLRLGQVEASIALLKTVETSTPRTPYEQNDRRLARLDLAQALARAGRADEAIGTLESIKRDFGLAEIELQDKDFDPLRAQPRFEALRTRR